MALSAVPPPAAPAPARTNPKIRRRCWNCIFWRAADSDPKTITGDCRRRAPTSSVMLVPYGAFPTPDQWPSAVWPITWHDDFCGDWVRHPDAKVINSPRSGEDLKFV